MKRNHVFVLALMISAIVVCMPPDAKATTYQDLVGHYKLKITIAGDAATGDVDREPPYEDPPELVFLPNNCCLFFESNSDKNPETWACELSENIVTLSRGADGKTQKSYMVELANGILAMTEVGGENEEGAATVTKYYFK